jgi:hypothetical protein
VVDVFLASLGAAVEVFLGGMMLLVCGLIEQKLAIQAIWSG